MCKVRDNGLETASLPTHLCAIKVRYISESFGLRTFTLWSLYLHPSDAWTDKVAPADSGGDGVLGT